SALTHSEGLHSLYTGEFQHISCILWTRNTTTMISWGEDSRNGFGSVKSKVLDGTKTDILHLSASKSVVAYIRNDGRSVSVARMHEDGGRRVTGKLKSVNCKEKIRTLSCGDSHVVLLSEGGRVLTLGTDNIPRPLGSLSNQTVTRVACGAQHSIALTLDGQVFTWGDNTSGQLGLGCGLPSAVSPQTLKSLSGTPLVQITAGGDHSFALSLSGAVFGWGKNTAGQLGLEDTQNRLDPVQIDYLNLKKTIFIACGEEHTAVLTKGGVVFTFGSGHYGQLGHNSLSDELRPRVVGELWGAKVTQIACGRHHTLALVKPSNKIYSFGCGEQGQLGNGVHINQSVPLPVQLPDQMNEMHVKSIYAGANNSFGLCSLDQESEEKSNKSWSSFGKVSNKLNTETVDKWISASNSKSWKKVKKEIKDIFSSASCLNGSFLDERGDKHYQTSPTQPGLDFSRVRGAFRKLAQKEEVLAEVELVVQNMLIPSLYKEPVGVEGLRIYLVLLELLRVLQKQNRGADLTESVAAAILKLHPNRLQILRNWWTLLKPSALTKHIGVWKKVLSRILTSGDASRSRDTGVKHLLQVLDHVYRANQNIGERSKLPEITFCMEGIQFNPVFLEEDIVLWLANKTANVTPAIFCCYPFVLNLLSKINIFNIYTALMNTQNIPQPFAMWPFQMAPTYFELRLKRASLIEDTFQQLSQANDSIFKRPLVVYFDEDLKLTDVYRRDFFHQLFGELLAPKTGMFMFDDTQTLAWFPAEPKVEKNRYFLFGVLCGMAMFNNSMVYLPFPTAFFKKLLNLNTSLEDLKEFCPVLAGSLQYILDYPDDDVENMDMTFSVIWDEVEAELEPEGTGKLPVRGTVR
ncbi:hypothetical protein DPEC_G00184750, partial [Dallia pectoralis]